jgi:hypothetical protein
MKYYVRKECPFGDIPCEECPHGRSPYWFPPCAETYVIEDGTVKVLEGGKWAPTLAVMARDLVPADQARPVRPRA